MRNKSKLISLLLSASLMLGGCSIFSKKKDASTPSEDVPAEVTPSESVEQGKSFSFEGGVSYFASEGFSGVVIPEYKCASSSATLTQPNAEEYPTAYVVKGSSASEMKTYVDTLETAGWTIFEESDGYYADLYAVEEEGAKTPEIFIGDFSDYSVEAFKGIVIQFMIYEIPVSAPAFPLAEVNAYLTEHADDYGFTLSQAEADALSALSSSFVFQSGVDSYGYPIAYVVMSGDVASQAIAVILDTITAAGFEWYESYGAYYNSVYCAIYTLVQDGYTYLAFN